MKRREFLGVLGSTAVAWPLTAHAQPSPVRPLIGLLSPLSAVAASRNVAAFRSALRDLGYVEGRNVTLALRYGDGAPERMPSLARELVALNPDVIFAGANSGALAAYQATRTIPIVAVILDDPTKGGFAQSIAKLVGRVVGKGLGCEDTCIVDNVVDRPELTVRLRIKNHRREGTWPDRGRRPIEFNKLGLYRRATFFQHRGEANAHDAQVHSAGREEQHGY